MIRPEAVYNVELRMSLARETLAQAIHSAQSVAFKLPEVLWCDVPHDAKEAYRATALEVLEKLKPEPREPSYYFSLAAEGVRAEYASIRRRQFGVVRAVADDIIDQRD